MSPVKFPGDSTPERELQSFLDGTVHGIRTPLRGIGTSAALLSQKWNDRLDVEGRELVRAILSGVSNLVRLTTVLAEYATALEPHSVMRLPAELAVQTAMAALRTQIAQTGATVEHQSLPRVTADHDQLGLLFKHLLSNALEHRNPAVAPHIEITASTADNQEIFAVKDNGAGIAPRYHRQIFEPYRRVGPQHGNIGLGLAVCQRIVEGHGGKIWVESSQGEGSTFFFTLPQNSEG